ncbi:MAG TPA: TetR/AcrR family transcriptional regulator [Acidimicrobiaceae bacterium]|nr:TetR/AcrR family transcriptional regulator [Acidimicrobiaceae bacterium]
MTGGTIELVRTDPRVRRTHRALHDAMVALCLLDGFRSVTVDQLVEHAGVTRATFYTHFRDKEHLLLALAEQVVGDVLDRFQQADGGDRLQLLFEDAEAHPDRLRVVLRGEGDGVALRRFVDAVAAVVAEVDVDALAAGMPPLVADPELAARAFAGQVVEVLRWWVDAGADGRPRPHRDDVVLQLRRLAITGRTDPADPRRSPLMAASAATHSHP